MCCLRRLPVKSGKSKKESKRKESKMNRTLKIGLLLLTVILVGLVAAFLVPYIMGGPFRFEQRDLSTQGPVPGDFEFFYLAQTIVSSINIVLLIALIVIYAGVYQKTKSSFTVGLIVFAIALLLKDLAANPFVIALFGFHLSGLGIFVLLPDLFETAALLVLLYLSSK
jgi:hypothetical protein